MMKTFALVAAIALFGFTSASEDDISSKIKEKRQIFGVGLPVAGLGYGVGALPVAGVGYGGYGLGLGGVYGAGYPAAILGRKRREVAVDEEQQDNIEKRQILGAGLPVAGLGYGVGALPVAGLGYGYGGLGLGYGAGLYGAYPGAAVIGRKRREAVEETQPLNIEKRQIFGAGLPVAGLGYGVGALPVAGVGYAGYGLGLGGIYGAGYPIAGGAILGRKRREAAEDEEQQQQNHLEKRQIFGAGLPVAGLGYGVGAVPVAGLGYGYGGLGLGYGGVYGAYPGAAVLGRKRREVDDEEVEKDLGPEKRHVIYPGAFGYGGYGLGLGYGLGYGGLYGGYPGAVLGGGYPGPLIL